MARALRSLQALVAPGYGAHAAGYPSTGGFPAVGGLSLRRRLRMRRHSHRRAGLALGDMLRAGAVGLPATGRARRIALVVALALTTLTGGYLIVRDSALVAVRQIQIRGVRGPHAAVIERALRASAGDMTTLDFDSGRLRGAIAPLTVIARLSVHTHFPHGVTIDVAQRLPVATLAAPGGVVTVADDGTLLARIAPPSNVPVLAVASLPRGTRVTDPATAQRVALLGAAPWTLIPHVDRVFQGPRGLEAILRRGPILFFGDGTDLHAKWIAAERVLRDPQSLGAVYIDLRIPDRPAAQVGVLAGSATSTGTSADATGAAGSASHASGLSPAAGAAATAAGPLTPAATLGAKSSVTGAGSSSPGAAGTDSAARRTTAAGSPRSSSDGGSATGGSTAGASTTSDVRPGSGAAERRPAPAASPPSPATSTSPSEGGAAAP